MDLWAVELELFVEGELRECIEVRRDFHNLLNRLSPHLPTDRYLPL